MDTSFSKIVQEIGSCAANAARTMLHETMLVTEGAVNGAILKPINAVEQIVDHVAGTHLPRLEFSNQKEVENSTAGKLGEIGGGVLSFVATEGALSAVGGLARGSTASLAMTGAVQGGLLRPSKEGKGDLDFVTDRLKHAAIDTATFATMGGISTRLAPALEGGSSKHTL